MAEDFIKPLVGKNQLNDVAFQLLVREEMFSEAALDMFYDIFQKRSAYGPLTIMWMNVKESHLEVCQRQLLSFCNMTKDKMDLTLSWNVFYSQTLEEAVQTRCASSKALCQFLEAALETDVLLFLLFIDS